jgi:hypothetical protein
MSLRQSSVAGVGLPGVVFWNRDAKKMRVINDQDLHFNASLRNQGIDSNSLVPSFGIVDSAEIRKRQNIIRFFMEKEDLRHLVLQTNLNCADIPMEENAFLRNFPENNGENPFWKVVDEFIEKTHNHSHGGQNGYPEEMVEFIRVLKQTRETAEEEDRYFSEKVAAEVLKSTELIGMVSFTRGDSSNASWNVGEAFGCGFQKYSYLTANWCNWEVPDWADNPLARFSGLKLLVKGVVALFNVIKGKDRYKAMAITETPKVIISAMHNFVCRALADAPKAEFYDNGTCRCGEAIVLYYTYDKNGLRVYLSDISTNGKNDVMAMPMESIFNGVSRFKGFSRVKRGAISKFNRVVKKSFGQTRDCLKFAIALTKFLESRKINLLDEGCLIKNKKVEMAYQWYSIPAICETICRDEYDQARKYRTYVKNHFEQLKPIAELAETLLAKSKEWKIGLSFPEILGSSSHLIAFDSLSPVYLIGRAKWTGMSKDREITAKDLIPLKGISLNGQIIGLTGQNAGGKTVTLETMVDNLIQAQSGLPIFGQGFKFNPKKAIALMFLERGEGSTFQLQLNKAKEVIRAAQEFLPEELVIVIDELGTGTQEADGELFGNRLLKTLAAHKPSIVFSTQIPRLAEYSQELGSQCYQFDLAHKIDKGIGKSGAEALMAEVGLSEMFTN